MTAARGWGRDAGRVLAATLLILLYALIQRGPMLYADSFAYYKIGAQATSAIHLWPRDRAATAPAHTPAPAAIIEARREARLSYTEAGARSAYYALPTYWFVSLGSSWLLAGVQALLVAMVVLIAFRHMAEGRFYLGAMAGLVAFSTLPLFAILIMPDFMTAPTIVAATLLVWRWPALSRGERIFLLGTLVFGGLIHTTHRIIAVLLGMGGLLLSWAAPRAAASRIGSAAIIVAVLVAALGSMLYPLAVRALTHENIYSPPFLTARLFSEGPWRDFLDRTCAKDENSFAMCRFRHEKVRDSNDFLWRPTSFYQRADYDTRVRMSLEDKKLFFGSLRQQPWVMARTSALNSLKMLVDFRPSQLLMTQSWLLANHDLIAHLAPEKSGCKVREPGCLARISPAWSDMIAEGGVLLGLIGIGMLMAYGWVDRKAWVPIVSFLLLGLVINAVICASLSSMVPRYQGRVAWLIPAAALMMAADAARRRRRAFTATGKSILSSGSPLRLVRDEPTGQDAETGGGGTAEARI